MQNLIYKIKIEYLMQKTHTEHNLEDQYGG